MKAAQAQAPTTSHNYGGQCLGLRCSLRASGPGWVRAQDLGCWLLGLRASGFRTATGERVEVGTERHMRYAPVEVRCFGQLIVVDAEFEVLYRAWCVAEIVEANVLRIPARIQVSSQQAVDLNYDKLALLDVRDCSASSQPDKDMILKKISDVDAFNLSHLVRKTAGRVQTILKRIVQCPAKKVGQNHKMCCN